MAHTVGPVMHWLIMVRVRVVCLALTQCDWKVGTTTVCCMHISQRFV